LTGGWVGFAARNFEGVKKNPPQRQPRVIAKAVAGIDYLVPFLDIGYVFFWVPGLILAILGYPLIVSWWSSPW
jgi:hypothetical protein